MVNPQLPPLIMDLLANNDTMTAEQISDAIQATYQTNDAEVYNALHWMLESEGMVRCDYPLWSLRPAWSSDRTALENSNNWYGGEE